MGVGSNLGLGLGLGLGLAQQYNGNSIVNVNGALLLLLVHGLSIDGLHRAAYSFWSLSPYQLLDLVQLHQCQFNGPTWAQTLTFPTSTSNHTLIINGQIA
jgi:hypothetical protein